MIEETKSHILLLEDEEDTSNAVKDRIERKYASEVEVHAFLCQADACAWLETTVTPPDLSLLDFKVPVRHNGDKNANCLPVADLIIKLYPSCDIVFFTMHPGDPVLQSYFEDLKEKTTSGSIVRVACKVVSKLQTNYAAELEAHIHLVRKEAANSAVRSLLSDPRVLSAIGAGPEICVRSPRQGPSAGEVMRRIERDWEVLTPSTRRLVEKYLGIVPTIEGKGVRLRLKKRES